MTVISAFYFGTVAHRRTRPRRHHLRYRMFWMLLDLDELSCIGQSLPGFSHNRFNLISFHDCDHGDGSATPLRPQIDRQLAQAGIDLHGGAVRLLAIPRVLGYGFNPISIYFCHFSDGTLAAILYEVHNTFGERHTYLFPGRMCGTGVHGCTKSLHVSPFLDMGMRYDFRTAVPGDRMAIAVIGSDRHGKLVAAAMRGERRPLDEKHLVKALVQFPFLTLKVISAIHWNALLLWLKRVPVCSKPTPPSRPVTMIGGKAEE